MSPLAPRSASDDAPTVAPAVARAVAPAAASARHSRGLYRRVWSAVPQPSVLLDVDLRILDANDAYLAASGHELADLVGAGYIQAAAIPGDAARREVEASLRRAAATGRSEDGLLVRWDSPAPAASDPAPVDQGHQGTVERWWTIATVPVRESSAPGSPVVALLSRLEDVTEAVLGHPEPDPSDLPADLAADAAPVDLDEAGDLTVADVLAASSAPSRELRLRSRALARVRATERALSARLASLSRMACDLAGATTLEQVTRIVIDHAPSVLGAATGCLTIAPEESSTPPVGRRLHGCVAGTFGQVQRSSSALGAVVVRTGEPVLLRNRREGVEFSPDVAAWAERSATQAWACLPLRSAGGDTLGALTIAWDTPQAFATGDVELLEAFSALAAQALDNWHLRQAERERAASLERLAVALQHSLLTEPVRSPTLQVAVRYLPALEAVRVGGDWYDAFTDRTGRTLVAVGDVAGHGQEAAAAMGQIRNLLRGIAHRGDSTPAQVLAALDDAMLDLMDGELATTVLAEADQDRAQQAQGAFRLRWSNAGHLPPLLILADGTARLLQTPEDLMLGFATGTTRGLHDVEVPGGATVLLYSDGLVERRGVHLDVTLAALASRAGRLAGLPVEALCDAVLAELAPGAADDVTLLVIRGVPVGAP